MRHLKTHLTCIAIVLVWGAALSSAHAQLAWETTHIEQSLELGQEEGEAVFRFTNEGTYPVTIHSTSTSCGCTAAAPTKTTYSPGEEGEIRASFSVGNRVGQRRNMIQVFTDDQQVRQHTLIYEVDIPRVVTISPRMLHWRAGVQANEPRTVSVELNPDAGLKLTGVEVDNELFDAEIEEDGTDRFLVKITPKSTKSPGRAIISLQTEPKLENDRHFSFYAYVR